MTRPCSAITIPFVIPLWALALVGCGDLPSTEMLESSVDADSVSPLQFREEVRIGHLTDVDRGLMAVEDIAVDTSGRIFAYDSGMQEVKVYGLDGSYLYRIGGEGEGPAEFRSGGMTRIGVRSDTLWAIQLHQRRWVLFNLRGDLLETGRFDPIPVPGFGGLTSYDELAIPARSRPVLAQVPLEPRGPGFISQVKWVSGIGASPLDTSRDPGDTISVPRMILDRLGRVVDTVGWEVRVSEDVVDPRRVKVEGVEFFVPEPPSDAALSVQTGGGRWLVDRRVSESARGRFEVLRLDLEGDTVARSNFRYRPKQYSSKELERIASIHAATPGLLFVGESAFLFRSRGGSRPTPAAAREAILDAMQFPMYLPPVLTAIANADGSIWLRTAGLPNLQTSGTWLILDDSARPVGRVVVPSGIRLMWASAHSFIGVRRNEIDVPWIIKYRLLR